MFCRKGYLYKNFVMSAILSEGVKPTLAELEKFEEAPEGMSIEVAAGEKEEMHNFTNGDRVEVVEGELLNLQGTVTKIEGTKITIMPKHDDLKEALEFQSNELKKYFAQVKPFVPFDGINLFRLSPSYEYINAEVSRIF